MSGAALSSAKQRRSVLKDSRGNPIPTTMQPSTSNQTRANETIVPQKPQIIPVPHALTMFDRRINILEQTVKNMMNNGTGTYQNNGNSNSNTNEDITELKNSVHRLNEMVGQDDRWTSVVEDMQTFASELDNLKNAIIKLQTYTMDVNKMLLEQQQQTTKTITDHMDGIIVEETA